MLQFLIIFNKNYAIKLREYQYRDEFLSKISKAKNEKLENF